MKYQIKEDASMTLEDVRRKVSYCSKMVNRCVNLEKRDKWADLLDYWIGVQGDMEQAEKEYNHDYAGYVY